MSPSPFICYDLPNSRSFFVIDVEYRPCQLPVGIIGVGLYHFYALFLHRIDNGFLLTTIINEYFLRVVFTGQINGIDDFVLHISLLGHLQFFEFIITQRQVCIGHSFSFRIRRKDVYQPTCRNISNRVLGIQSEHEAFPISYLEGAVFKFLSQLCDFHTGFLPLVPQRHRFYHDSRMLILILQLHYMLSGIADKAWLPVLFY